MKTPKSKTCTKCGKEKKIVNFGKNSRRKDKLESQCKKCINKQVRARRNKKKLSKFLTTRKAIHKVIRDKKLHKRSIFLGLLKQIKKEE